MAEENQIQKKKSKAWIFIVLAVAVIGIVTVIILMSAKGNDKLSKQLDLAQQYLMEMDYEQAIAAYEEAIKIDPKSTDAYLGLAEVYISMTEADDTNDKEGGYQEAIDALDRGYSETESEVILERKKELEIILESYRSSDVSTDNNADSNDKETEENAAENEIMKWNTDLSHVKVGDVVNYGHKEDLSGPIEWQVLDVQDGYALLFANENLFTHQVAKVATTFNNDMSTILYEREINRIKEVDANGGLNPIFPPAEWTLIYHETFEGHSNKLGNYIAKEKFYGRRYTETDPERMKYWTEIKRGQKWFLLSWSDIEKYLVGDKSVINVNCDGKIGENRSRLEFSYMSSSSWLTSNYMKYEYKHDYYAEGREDINIDDDKMYVVINMDDNVNVGVVSNEGTVGIRPAMWVSISE